MGEQQESDHRGKAGRELRGMGAFGCQCATGSEEEKEELRGEVGVPSTEVSQRVWLA